MILQKMSEFQFPEDNSPEHWNKLMGQEINFMIKHKANINSFFIVADRYFEISVIIINSKGNILVLNGKNAVGSYQPFSKDEIVYVYSKNPKCNKKNVMSIKKIQNEIQCQKIKNTKKGKKLNL
jgi:hypothetical protein